MDGVHVYQAIDAGDIDRSSEGIDRGYEIDG
jgi:hypothetical protein